MHEPKIIGMLYHKKDQCLAARPTETADLRTAALEYLSYLFNNLNMFSISPLEVYFF